jgi:alpha-galactosidase/6-phospho-beta-glucosidase family protein
MDDVKVVIIGAGSTVFTPGLIADLANSNHLHDATVALVDIKPAAVETMRRFAERVARERGVGLRVVAATDRRDVLPGATFVTTTIAVGGAAAWERDLRIPERHGVHQTVGDSVGPGGVFRALRHVPELVAIARDMEELCPDAWLFNYTNPLSALVRAVHKTSPIRCVGLCHGILHTRHVLARDLDVPAHELNVVAAGVNHLCWTLDLRHHGQDLYPRLRAKLRAELAAPSALYGDGAYDAFQQVSARLTALYGLYPSPGDRHVAEFFPYFLHGDGGQLPYGTQAGLDLTNEILSTKDTLWERITAQAEGTAPLDDDLFAETREGERVVSIMEAILFDQPLLELAVNVRNDGLIPRLPDWAVVEVPGLVSGYGVRGIGVAPLPQAIADILRARVYQQELTVDAALTGDRALALQALLADPLIPRLETAEAMLDEALAAHAQYLPQFSRAPASAPPRALSDAAA